MAVNALITPPAVVIAPFGASVGNVTYAWDPGPMIEAIATRLSAADITTQAQFDARIAGNLTGNEIQMFVKAFAQGFQIKQG